MRNPPPKKTADSAGGGSSNRRALTASGYSRAKPAVFGAYRGMTASAQKVDLKSAASVNRPHSAWQDEAWTGFERVGEIHYGFSLVANIMSRIRLYAAAVMDADEVPLVARDAAKDDYLSSQLAQDATDVMNDLMNADGSTMLRTFAINIQVPGECLLIHLPDKDDPTDPDKKVWTIRSTDEVVVRGVGGAELVPMRGATGDRRILPEDTYIARIWRASARYSMEPDSSMAAISDPIEELLMLQRLVRSAARSRLNAGILYIPDGITVARETTTPDGQPDEMVQDPGNTFLDALMDAMVTPVTDEGAPSAVVPMVITGPGDLGPQITHKTFERSSDDWLVNRQERALERILQGMDAPKEIVTGLANVKFANAVVIDENLYRANIEPLCLMLADALTDSYLRPMLRAKGYEDNDLDRVVVWYDPSEIVTRPNQAAEATNGYDRYLLSPSAWRREHGFSDTDAPSEEELAFMLLADKGQLPDDITAALLQRLLPKLLGEERASNIENSVVPFPTSAQSLLNGTDTTTSPGPAAGTTGRTPSEPTPLPVPAAQEGESGLFSGGQRRSAR